MRHIIFIISLLLATVLTAQNLDDFRKIEVTRYQFKPGKEFRLLIIPASFSNSELLNKTRMDSLKGKKIASVRLVYTRYGESKNFDQAQLNKKRIQNLVAIHPALFSNPGINWYSVEQTAEDSMVAKSLFHGFYILYYNKPPEREYAINHKLFNTKGIQNQYFKIINHRDTLITGIEGSKILIHSNCFIDENKRPYRGTVKIEVKEAIKMESIILGNMVTMADDNALESGGMIYIDARSADGKSLTLRPDKPLEVTVPSNQVKPEMKVWQAEQSGKFINWKNPKALIENKASDNNQMQGVDDQVVMAEKQPEIARLNKFTLNDSLIFDSRQEYENDPAYISHLRTFNHNIHKIYINYISYKNNKIKISLIKFEENGKKKIIFDTVYNGAPYHNNNIPLSIPKCAVKYSSYKIYYGMNTFSWIPFKNIDLAAYKFNFSEIGNWANIDCVAGDIRTKTVDFTASLPQSEKFDGVAMYLIFKDKNIYIPGYKSQTNGGYGFSHGDFEAPKLPVGANATVLCVAYIKDQPYIAMQNITIAQNQKIVMNPKASSDEAIKKLIKDSF